MFVFVVLLFFLSFSLSLSLAILQEKDKRWVFGNLQYAAGLYLCDSFKQLSINFKFASAPFVNPSLLNTRTISSRSASTYFGSLANSVKACVSSSLVVCIATNDSAVWKSAGSYLVPRASCSYQSIMSLKTGSGCPFRLASSFSAWRWVNNGVRMSRQRFPFSRTVLASEER